MQVKPLIELMRRVQKSKFNSLIMHDRMIIQCYDVSEDSDSGTHYIMHIPINEDYDNKFYNQSLIIYPESFVNTYKDGHNLVLEKKKENKIPAKDIVEFVEVDYYDDVVELTFQHIVQDKLIASNIVGCRYAKVGSTEVNHIAKTLNELHHRIKKKGLGIRLDGFKNGYYYKIMNHPQITYSKVVLGDTKVRIPLFKSMLAGIKTPDEFMISVQETNIKDIYIYTVQITNKGLTDQFISYILNF